MLGFAVALGCGLLIGIERERRKGRGPRRTLAGVRTFTLAALLGALAAASTARVLVGLPLVPSTHVAWLGGVDPRRLWALVVLLIALQAAAYVALRVAGPRIGLGLSGLASGFISSTATIAAMAARARAEPGLLGAC